MNWEELRAYLKDKTFLIGLTFMDEKQRVLEEYQTSGMVLDLTENALLSFKRKDNSLFYLPYDQRSIFKAQAGQYKAKSTGETVINPDYLTTWTITVKDKSELAKIKSHGFIP